MINVLVENKTDRASKFFGRSEHMTSVIFDGNYEDVGKVVKIKVITSNRSTLFGEKVTKNKLKVA